MLRLPIDDVLPRVVAALRESSAVVLLAETGAGKTTRVPPALLDAGIVGAGQIVVLEPRRLAARAAASRIAFERGWRVGEEVGYQVRFERRAGRDTRLLVVTEGVFVRRLLDDPFLEDVSVVVFDEFHERSLDADLALAMTRRVQREVRPELKVVVMSATLEAGPIAAFLGDCPVIESSGRLFPVATRYLSHAPQGGIIDAVVAGVLEVMDETPGDVLVFLPGVAEIQRTRRALEARRLSDVAVMELYGDMPLERQQEVLAARDRRKIVLATNVAETSITIEGVTGVVDSGLARVLRLDPTVGIDRLETERISRASAEQRSGRAGRTQPGVCLRLWTRRQHEGLAERNTPEILRGDLSGAALDLVCWGEADVAKFEWFERPPPEHVEQAMRVLRRLGAIGDRGVTEIGRQLARLPVHPRVARLLVEGHRLGHPREAAMAAALLSERDPFRRDGRISNPSYGRGPAHRSASDVVDRVGMLMEIEAGTAGVNPAARFVLRARDQLVRTMSGLSSYEEVLTEHPTWEEVVMRAVAVAFMDRLARRRAGDASRGVMLGGRGVRLSPDSAVREADLFVCVELQELGQSEALVRQASAVDRSWLDATQIATAVEIEFDAKRQRVVAFRRTRIEDLVLDEAAAAIPSDADAGAILARELAARVSLPSLLDEAALRLAARIEFLRQSMPELGLPAIDEQGLGEMLPTVCAGCISLDDVRNRGFEGAIRGRLSYEQWRAVEQHAPERIEVPSGSHVAIQYAAAAAPVLAVRIQELFGLTETPRIAGGRVPLVLHLLGPNYRPQQITADLASFWRNGYPEVRKELRRRYPKHAWPEDPLRAAAERRPGRGR